MNVGFFNPWVLPALVLAGLPVLIHLLNRYQSRTIQWGAMRLLRRVVRVKSRELRLQDILLMLLRCLILLLIILAIARPTTTAPVKATDVGAVIGLDVSGSMAYKAGARTRFDHAVEQVRGVLDTIDEGRPVGLALMGEDLKILRRNTGYDRADFESLLEEVRPTGGGMNLTRALEGLVPLTTEMRAPEREVYLVTDLQRSDWEQLPAPAEAALRTLAGNARVIVVSTASGGSENVAVTDLRWRSGSLRRNTIARYEATVRNFGTGAAKVGPVELAVGETAVDRQEVGTLEPGDTVSVSLYAPFQSDGMLRLEARTGTDALASDNARRLTAHVREKARVLTVDGEPSEGLITGAATYVTTALQPGGVERTDLSLQVETVPWLALNTVALSGYDSIFLANVPDMPDQNAESLRDFVESGGGVFFLLGDKVDAETYNDRFRGGEQPLLPARLGKITHRKEGLPLDLEIPGHPLVSSLRELPTDLLTESSVRGHFEVEPDAESRVLLRLADGTPLLLEKSVGRGLVLLLTTSADRSWHDLALSPVFPIIVQQAVTHFESMQSATPLVVGDPLFVSVDSGEAAVDGVLTRPDGSKETFAVADEDRGSSISLGDAAQIGFYTVALGDRRTATAVNAEASESDVRALEPSALRRVVPDVLVVGPDRSAAAAVRQGRRGRELWPLLLGAALLLLAAEAAFARWQTRKRP